MIEMKKNCICNIFGSSDHFSNCKTEAMALFVLFAIFQMIAFI